MLALRSISLISWLLFPISLFSQTGAWTIDTLAGTDRPVKDGVPGTSSLLNTPGSVVVDGSGNIIFADTNNHRVRKIAPNGIITTIAGTGNPGNSGDSQPAVGAQLISPQGLALDSKGNLYISDYAANVVRMVAPSGIIATIAGSGVPGNANNGGKATAASLSGPYALAFDPAGNLYIAEDLGNTVRKVTPAGIISAFTTSQVRNPEGLAVDSSGNVYVASWYDDKIYEVLPTGALTAIAGNGNAGFSGDGGAATAAALSGPQGIAFDASGTLWICDSLNNRIRSITGGKIQTVIGSGYSGLSGIGTSPTAISVYLPLGLSMDAKGTVYWTEAGNHRVRYYTPANQLITEIAGYTPSLSATGGPGSLPLFNPFGTATDAAGNLYIADTGNHVIRKVTPAGVSSVVAGTGNANFNGDVGTATAVDLTFPEGVAVDPQGNILIADSGNGRIRKVDTNGRMTTLMGAGNGLPFPGTFAGSDFLFYPTGVVATSTGGFVAVDEYFGLVVSVDNLGQVSLVPTQAVNYLALPTGVAVSGTNIYIADTFDNRILKYDGKTISVVAGTGIPGYAGDNGPAVNARLFFPYGIAVDSKNNLYIADTFNTAIRMVDTTGKITTIAGTGLPGFSGDKGLAINAQFSSPSGVNVDAAGNIEVTDSLNQRIRVLQFQTIQPDVTLKTDSAAKSANHGASAPLQITLTSVGGFAGSANITANVPAGMSVQYSPAVPANIAAGQTLTITATVQIAAATAPGAYTLGFTLNAGSIQHTVAVTLNVTDLPQLTSASVVNAASYAGGGVSPGEIIAIFGQDLGPAAIALGGFDSNGELSTQVGGTQVTFDGVPAPLIYSLAAQLSAIVPYEIKGQSTSMQVQYNGRSSATVTLNVVDAAPGIFTSLQSSQAAALNTDLSVNSAANPAAAGSIVVLFATGEGQTNPGGTDGKLATSVFPAPLLPVTVTIGGAPADVLYDGAGPYEVAGVFQLNVRIPANTPSGPAAVAVSVGTRTSASPVTIAVQ